MGFRRGNSYRIAIGLESAFNSGGTVAGTPATTTWETLTVLANPIEFNFAPEAIDTGYKTGNALPTACETAQGYRTGTVRISGALSDDHEIFLKGVTHDSTSPYTWAAKPNTTLSFVVYRIWDDVNIPATNYTVDKATGCRVESLSITGSSGGLVTFEATLTAATYVEEGVALQSITGTDPGQPCHEPFNFGNSSYSGNFADETGLKSFSLTLTPIYADNAALFQNSNTRLSDVIVKWSGELNIVGNYDPETIANRTNEWIHGGYQTGSPEQITLANSAKTWGFDIPIEITALSLPDPDEQLFEISATGRIIYDATSGDVFTATVASA